MEDTNRDNTFKVNVFGALIIAMSLIIIAISGSYAFFINRVEKVNADHNGLVISSGDLKMTFTTDNNYNDTSAKLIDVIGEDETLENVTKDKLESLNVDKTTFSIAVDEASKVDNANFELYLTDVTISEKLMNKYLCWVLFENGILKETGDFEGIEGTQSSEDEGLYEVSKVPILESAQASKTPSSYTLYVWLENDANVNQADPDGIDLREGKFDMKVGFKANTVPQS